MSEPKYHKNKRGTDPSFDFLGEEAANRPSPAAGRPETAGSRKRQAPIIRKPVPIEKLGSISESGLPSDHDVAATPPSKAAPDPNDDLDLLGPPARQRTPARDGARAAESAPRRPASRVPTPLDDIDDEFSQALEQRRGAPPPERRPRGARASDDARQSSPIDAFEQDWREGVGRSVAPAPRSRRWRGLLLLCALSLLGTGAWFIWDRELDSLTFDWPWQGRDVGVAGTPTQPAPSSDTAPPGELAVPDGPAVPRPAPLAQRFRDQLAALEALVDDGELAEAREALDSMDRTVYGYGRAEFDAIAERIARNDDQAEAERQAERQAEAELREQADAERRAEAEREAAAAEQEAATVREREAAEQAAERQAAQARQAEVEAEQLRQAEEERRAALSRQAEIDRAVQAREAALARQAQSDREIQNAEARQAAADRARQAAIEAQARADATARRRDSEGDTSTAAGADLPISDADLQEVYSRFLELATAIEQRDINTVIDLTRPSGARIQQFLQVFENTQSVYTRIASMATRRAEGVIVGNLIIDRLVRADGTIVDAPAAIRSIRLSSARTPDGWSAIEW